MTNKNDPILVDAQIRIKVKHKKAYGHDRYYPLCPLSQMICDLTAHNTTKRTCLTQEQIDLIKSHNWLVEITP